MKGMSGREGKHQVRWSLRAPDLRRGQGSGTLAAPAAPGTGGRHRLAQATAGHHTTFGELVPTQVSCWGCRKEMGSGWGWVMGTTPHSDFRVPWMWHPHVTCVPYTWAGRCTRSEPGQGEGGGAGCLPRRSSSWAQTVRTQISLLTTYIRRRLGGQGGGRGQPHRHPALPGEPRQDLVLEPWSPNPQARAQPGLSSASGFTLFPQTPPGPAGAAPSACLCSPVEADLVETLFAGLVYGVEAGARVLLLTAVWVTGRIRLGGCGLGPRTGGEGSP